MAEELSAKIAQLERLVDQQSRQIEILQNAEPRTTSTTQATQNFDPTRIPDVIKMIPEYCGLEIELPAWLNSVERKLECARKTIPHDKISLVMPIWESIIRDKITGKANEALLMSGTNCTWTAIKEKLKERFGDKRDLSAILSRIAYLKQSAKNVEEFYYECDAILSDLKTKVMLDDEMKPCAKTIIASYESMLINAYIDGLHEPISSLTRTSRPTTLLSAYQHALEQANAASRRREKFRLETKPVSAPQKPMQFKQEQPRFQTWNQNRGINYYGNSNPRPAHQFNNYQNQNRPVPQYNNFQNHPNFRPQIPQQQINTKPPLAIKQEVPSGYNIRRFQNTVNNHDEQQNPEEGYSYYPEEMEETDEGHPDEVNFQQDPNEQEEL